MFLQIIEEQIIEYRQKKRTFLSFLNINLLRHYYIDVEVLRMMLF